MTFLLKSSQVIERSRRTTSRLLTVTFNIEFVDAETVDEKFGLEPLLKQCERCWWWGISLQQTVPCPSSRHRYTREYRQPKLNTAKNGEQRWNGTPDLHPPRFWNISTTRRNVKIRFHLFLEGPIPHTTMMKSWKNSNRISRETGIEDGVGGF